MTLLVAMLAVPGCVYMLESVFFLNVAVFGVSDSLAERIHIFSVGNGLRLACHVHRVH